MNTTQVNSDNQTLPLNRLEHFPVMLFAVVMGLGGLAIAYQKAHEILGLPAAIGNGLAYLSSGIFILLALAYLLKLTRYPAAVLGEFRHPIRVHFFAAISISLLLLAVALQALHGELARWLWIAGALLHGYLTLHTVRFWINHNFEIQHSNPAWFIPIVGNVVVPVAGVDYAPLQVSIFFFAIGLFFWIILFTLVLNRIVFHHQLPAKFMPTLFIFIAPPAVAFLAYYKLTGQYDFNAQILYSLALFFTLLIGFMYKNFIGLSFFISWWAFTFPLAAMTIATLLSYKLSGMVGYHYFAYAMLAFTTLAVALVAWRTAQHMLKGEVCVAEK
jgi:tellurite resistance protein